MLESAGDREGEVPEVLVVGSGAAGLAAALAARAAGASAWVVAAGEGQSGVATGTWDLGAGPEPAPLSDDRTLAALLAELPRVRPAHPLAASGAGHRAALAEVIAALSAAAPGLVTPGIEAVRPLVVTELGLFRRPGMLQRAVLDLAGLPRARVAVVRLSVDVPGLDAAFVAASLGELTAEANDARRFTAVPVQIDGSALGLDASGVTGGLADLALARALDRPPAREHLALVLGRALGNADFDAVLLPPILGLETDDARDVLELRLGRRVGEVTAALAGPQAVRWGAAQARALEACGASCVRADVQAVELERDGVVVSLVTPDGLERRLEVPSVVLATGKPTAASLVRDGGILREPVAGLPIHDRGRPLALRGNGDELGSRAGARVDAEMRALGDDLQVLSERLFACGALLDDLDVTGHGSGRLGAALSGWIAGRGAARQARARPGRTIPRATPASP